jgi:hypothetical protein
MASAVHCQLQMFGLGKLQGLSEWLQGPAQRTISAGRQSNARLKIRRDDS